MIREANSSSFANDHFEALKSDLMKIQTLGVE